MLASLKGMLLSLTPMYWKSFGGPSDAVDTTQIVFFGQVTLLVGPNASGKSNVLDGLRLLQGTALDLPFYEALRGRWEGGREVWPGIRGGEAEASGAGSSMFGLITNWKKGNDGLTHFLAIRTQKEIEVHSESLADSTKDLFNTQSESLGSKAGHQVGGAINVALRSKGSGKLVSQSHRSSRSLLGQIEPADRVAPEVFEGARYVRNKLREIVFFDLQPRTMRQASPVGAPSLGVSGENLSAMLHGMESSKLADLVDWLSELCAPSIEGIEFEESKHSRAVFFLLSEKGGKKISCSSISDGTLRFLGILTALLTAPNGSIVVFEEPDIGLHPARVHLLAELLEELPKKRDLQVIATTHSPGLLAHLSDASLANVMAFDRDASSNLTLCRRLKDLPNFEILRSSRERDHLIATGWLERAV